MCGIAGLVRPVALWANDKQLVDSMLNALVHRGPDDQGIYLADRAALGARRLSIVDVKSGHQPLEGSLEGTWISYNGEIYNHIELRAELQRKGHQFRTATDTEVVVNAYLEWGEECVDHMIGMFAFAIWDDARKILFAARDHFGIKPFYYCHRDSGFVFASELKALQRCSELNREINLSSVHHYLTLQYVPDPQSILAGVRRLPAAHTLVLENNQLRLKKYWKPEFEPKLEIDETEAVRELRRLLTRSVSSQLMGERAIGALLSGGLDSSIIVGLIAQITGEGPRTFAVGSEEPKMDERPFAKAVAERWNCRHTEIVATSQGVLDQVSRMAGIIDEPFSDPSAIQLDRISQIAAKDTTVLLGGDGCDEPMAGYQRYWMDSWIAPYRKLPGFVTQSMVPFLLSPFTAPTKIAIEQNWVAGLKRLAQVSRTDQRASIIAWGSYFDESAKRTLYTPEMQSAVEGTDTASLLIDTYEKASALQGLDRTLHTDLSHYLVGNHMVKLDRVTMANSIEARVPYLDLDYVNFVSRLPTRMKLAGRTGKYLLRKAFADLLPSAVLNRSKQGFSSPIEKWLREDLAGVVRQVLLDDGASIHRIVEKSSLESTISQHVAGRSNQGRRIWSLFVLETWLSHQPTE